MRLCIINNYLNIFIVEDSSIDENIYKVTHFNFTPGSPKVYKHDINNITKDKEHIYKLNIDELSNIVFELLSYMAEKERLKIKQRQAEGIAAAKSKGKKFGRPRISYPDNWEEVYTKLKDGKITAVKAMELTSMKKTSFYKLIKQYENK